MPNLATAKMSFSFGIWKGSKLTPSPTVGTYAAILGRPRIWNAELGSPQTCMLVIAKKMLDKNHFKAAHKTMDRTPPSFKIGDRVYFNIL